MTSTRIVAIDFGTYGTGIAIADQGLTKHDLGSKFTEKVHLPMSGPRQYPKHRTSMLYNADFSSVVAWGDAAVDKAARLPSPATDIFIESVKLLLDDQWLASPAGQQLLAQLGDKKSPVQVVADYLQSLAQCAADMMSFRDGQTTNLHQIRWILTVPAALPIKSMAAMREAMFQAGLIPTQDSANLQLCLEPGAALLSVDMASKDLTSGDNILVVDCGTGTVDFAAFGKQLLAGADKTSSFNELTRGRTIAMGSMSVDMEFERHMESVFGRVGWDAIALDAAGRTKIFKEWEDIKHGYDGEYVGLSELPLSRSAFKLLKGAGIADTKAKLLAYNRTLPGTADMDDDELEDVVMLAGATLRRLFDKVVSDIVQVTAEMMADCAANGTNITKVVCVGGFSANKYLLRSIRDMVGTKYPAARVLAPSNSASAVLYGTVIYGVAHGVIKSCVPSTAADTAMASRPPATSTTDPEVSTALRPVESFVTDTGTPRDMRPALAMAPASADSALATSSMFVQAITGKLPVASAIAATTSGDSAVATSAVFMGAGGSVSTAPGTAVHADKQPTALPAPANRTMAEKVAIKVSKHSKRPTPKAAGDAILDANCSAFLSGQHRVIKISGKAITQIGLRILAAIAASPTERVYQLDLSNINFPVIPPQLTNWLPNHTLYYLNLAGNRLGDHDIEALSKQLPATLGVLHLASNAIADRGCVALASCMPKQLVMLVLTSNRIGAAGATLLAMCLPPTLIGLGLGHNQLGPVGAASLAPQLPAGLKTLGMGSNAIGDPGALALAERISALTDLAELHLDNNAITDVGIGAIAAALPRQLVELHLQQNAITAKGIWVLAPTLPLALTKLYLWGNSIMDPGAVELLAKCLPRGLEVLYLSSCMIGDLGAIQLAKYIPQRLTELFINTNNISDKGMRALAPKLPATLKRLSLSNNAIGADGATALAAHLPPAIEELQLNRNTIGPNGAQALAARFPSATLAKLGLWGNGIGDAGAVAIARTMPASLTDLQLNYNLIGDLGAVELASAPALSKLHTLSLDNNNIGAVGIAALAPQFNRAMTKLFLWNNRLGAAGIAALAQHLSPLVEELHLSGTEMADAGAAALAKSLPPTLRVLSIEQNRIGDAGVMAVAGNLPAGLVRLGLWGNQIGDAGVTALAGRVSGMAHLAEIHLANNHIGDAGALKLVQSSPPSLRSLMLLGNQISVTAEAAIVGTTKVGLSVVLRR